MEFSCLEYMLLKWKPILSEATWCAGPLEVSRYFLKCRGRVCQITGAKHQTLHGISKQKDTKTGWNTAQAEAYPLKFCKHLAKALVIAVKQM